MGPRAPGTGNYSSAGAETALAYLTQSSIRKRPVSIFFAARRESNFNSKRKGVCPSCLARNCRAYLTQSSIRKRPVSIFFAARRESNFNSKRKGGTFVRLGLGSGL